MIWLITLVGMAPQRLWSLLAALVIGVLIALGLDAWITTPDLVADGILPAPYLQQRGFVSLTLLDTSEGNPTALLILSYLIVVFVALLVLMLRLARSAAALYQARFGNHRFDRVSIVYYVAIVLMIVSYVFYVLGLWGDVRMLAVDGLKSRLVCYLALTFLVLLLALDLVFIPAVRRKTRAPA